MASRRLATPMRGVTYQLSRLSIRHNAIPRSLATAFARSITTSTSSQAAVSPITTSADGFVPIKPFDQQTVLATIHQFPSLEPLRFESFPANHLNLPTRKDILHRAIVYEGDMTRLGTASTKTRYEVRGSARKVRPQKGTGRARLGDKKSPMLKGGGVAHGPRPRDFSTELQKKVYDLAWRTALSYRYRKGELVIVDNPIEIESPSVRLLNDIFKSHEKQRGKGRSLFITLEERPIFEQALYEMDRGRQALTWEEVDVKDLLELSRVVIEREALHNILLSHQEDLTHTPIPPWHKSFIRSSPPSDLESIPGWEEFRDLMLVAPSERDAIRPDAYESVAAKRYDHAQTLPEGSPEQQGLLVAAYELLAEAKDLRRAKLPTLDAIQHQINIKTALAVEAGKVDQKKADQVELEIRELVVKFYDIQVQGAVLDAQALEHRSEALEKSGQESGAEDMYTKARGVRTDVANFEAELLNAKFMVADQKAKILQDRNDIEGAQIALAEAQMLREKHEAKIAENETLDEAGEEELADLELIEDAEKKDETKR